MYFLFYWPTTPLLRTTFFLITIVIKKIFYNNNIISLREGKNKETKQGMNMDLVDANSGRSNYERQRTKK